MISVNDSPTRRSSEHGPCLFHGGAVIASVATTVATHRKGTYFLSDCGASDSSDISPPGYRRGPGARSEHTTRPSCGRSQYSNQSCAACAFIHAPSILQSVSISRRDTTGLAQQSFSACSRRPGGTTSTRYLWSPQLLTPSACGRTVEIARPDPNRAQDVEQGATAGSEPTPKRPISPYDGGEDHRH